MRIGEANCTVTAITYSCTNAEVRMVANKAGSGFPKSCKRGKQAMNWLGSVEREASYELVRVCREGGKL